MDAAVRRGSRAMVLVKAADPLRAEFFGDTLGVVRSIDSALAQFPLDSLPPLDRPYFDFAHSFLVAGRNDRATALLTQLERVHPTAVTVFGTRMVPFLRGRIARAETRWTDAIRELRAADSLGCSKCVAPYLADAYDGAGNADSAIAIYERYVTSASIDFAIFTDQYWIPIAYKRLGELYEAKRDRVKARKYYESFVDLWRNADPELQLQVRAVRERLRVIGAQDR
jgi:tetratricopeptide (TPR) repeat protein